MQLSEWKQQFTQLLEEGVDSYLDEHADELFEPNPLKSIELQRRQAKKEMIRKFRNDNTLEHTKRALCLIRDLLPQMISESEWATCVQEFRNSGNSLCEFFQKEETGELSKEVYIPLYERLGISTETLKHCYELGQWHYNRRDYYDSSSIFKFLTTLASDTLEFWIALGMSHSKMKQYQQAINTYKNAQDLFGGVIALHIHCAHNHIANSDRTNAAIELDDAKKLLNENPEYNQCWGEMYDYLRILCDEMYENE